MSLIGFNSIKQSILNSYSTQKLHHAILLNGKKGVGKSSFAKEFIKEILATKNTNHPDFLLIEKDAEKREITVDKIRKISDFINQTSAISDNKFILIDSACELNKSASNALLKILEEPHQNNFLILISHNLSRVLPTIRSRCQLIKIPNLSFADFAQILQERKPQISTNELQFLAEICHNSPAEAIHIGSDLSRLYSSFLLSLHNKKINEDFLKKISEKNFSFAICQRIFDFLFNRLYKFLANSKDNFSDEELAVFINLAQKFSREEIFMIVDESLILLHKVLAMNLDKKLCIINIFNKISHDKNL